MARFGDPTISDMAPADERENVIFCLLRFVSLVSIRGSPWSIDLAPRISARVFAAISDNIGFAVVRSPRRGIVTPDNGLCAAQYGPYRAGFLLASQTQARQPSPPFPTRKRKF